ncbi:MAG TPA: class I SAM-dependent methyltransferase [Actinomycetota bacterium]|nr:class I SAM-dependent methyltransferase [Actinomycetota bacterium]
MARPAPVPARLDAKTANIRYHDAAASSYDDKWSIGFDARAVRYVRERAERMLPDRRYGKVLEIGAGTGFFLLNLWQAGYTTDLHATDISEGMLEVCSENAARLGCTVATRSADAERLPYDDGEFDLVVGHAFLHHIPEPDVALREIARVVRPGGAVFIAGEPTRWGHRLAEVAKVTARTAWRTAALIPGADIRRPAPPAGSEQERILRDLEFEVDLHTFDPGQVVRWAEAAGFTDVRIETEELLASLFGWSVRTMEAEARPGLLGRRWALAAYLGWRGLSAVDRALAAAVPKRFFYNLLLFARKPGGG